MKLAIATVALMTATTVNAESMVSFGGQVDANYAMDAKNMTVEITPEITVAPTEGLAFVAGTTLAIWDDELVFDNTLDVMPSLDFEMTYTMSSIPTLEWYTSTSYDLDAKARGEINFGATFAF